MLLWIQRTLDDEVRSEDTHGRDTDTGLGSTIRGAEAGEDDGRCATHGTEEGLDDVSIDDVAKLVSRASSLSLSGFNRRGGRGGNEPHRRGYTAEKC